MTTTDDQPTFVPVTLATINGPVEVQGEQVAPGVAITESIDSPGWYHLTHMQTGMGYTAGGPLQDRNRMREAGRALAAGGHPRTIIDNLYTEPETVEQEHGMVQAGDVLHLLPENQPEVDAEGYSWGDAATWEASYNAAEAELDAYNQTVGDTAEL